MDAQSWGLNFRRLRNSGDYTSPGAKRAATLPCSTDGSFGTGAPRINKPMHLLRNVPPADILSYAGGHDDWTAARQVVFLHPSLGGLGLLAAERISPAAYWAAWAPRRSSPASAGVSGRTCAAMPARQQTKKKNGPAWASGARGAAAPAAEGELGQGNPGWQRHAVLALHISFRERMLLPAWPSSTLSPVRMRVCGSRQFLRSP